MSYERINLSLTFETTSLFQVCKLYKQCQKDTAVLFISRRPFKNPRFPIAHYLLLIDSGSSLNSNLLSTLWFLCKFIIMTPTQFSSTFKDLIANPDATDYELEFMQQNSPAGIMLVQTVDSSLHAEECFYKTADADTKMAVNSLAQNKFISYNNQKIQSRATVQMMLVDPSCKSANTPTAIQLMLFWERICGQDLLDNWDSIWDQVRQIELDKIFESETKDAWCSGEGVDADSLFMRPSKAESTLSPRTAPSSTTVSPYRDVLAIKSRTYTNILNKIEGNIDPSKIMRPVSIPEFPEEEIYINLEPLYLKHLNNRTDKLSKFESEFLESARRIKNGVLKSTQDHSKAKQSMLPSLAPNKVRANSILTKIETAKTISEAAQQDNKFPILFNYLQQQQVCRQSSEQQQDYMPPQTNVRLNMYPPAVEILEGGKNPQKSKEITEAQKSSSKLSQCCCTIF